MSMHDAAILEVSALLVGNTKCADNGNAESNGYAPSQCVHALLSTAGKVHSGPEPVASTS